MHDAQLVNPNLHIALVHFPIALLIVGMLIELFSFLGWRRSGFRTAGRWMIFLGVLSGIPTALAGLYAMNDLVRRGLPEGIIGAHWADALAASALVKDSRAWAMMQLHGWINAGVTAVLTIAVVLWAGGSDLFRRFMYVPVMMLLLLGIAGISVSAWYGGEMVYRQGVGVLGTEKLPARDVEPIVVVDASLSTTAPATQSTTGPSFRRTLTFYLPPMQTHMILAGFAIAMAMGATAASFRRASVLADIDQDAPLRQAHATDYSTAFGGPPGSYPTERGGGREFFAPPGVRAELIDDSVPGGRFWLLTFLLALLTALVGVWVFTRSVGIPPADLIRDAQTLWRDDIYPNRRRLFHILAGSAIVLLPLLLALIARFAPRQKVIMFIIALWLLAAVAAQVWLGTLLLWDGPSGPWNSFHLAAP